jgi:hypothetical protein
VKDQACGRKKLTLEKRLHIAGFCDDAALKLKRTLNGKSSMLLREHNPIDNSVTGDTMTVQGSRV